MITEWVPESARIELHAARVAAVAARAVPGVERLQPRLWGLVRQLARQTWRRTTGGEDRPDAAGVHAELCSQGTLEVEVFLVVALGHRATVVCDEAQRAVGEALRGAPLDASVGSVRVHVVDIVMT